MTYEWRSLNDNMLVVLGNDRSFADGNKNPVTRKMTSGESDDSHVVSGRTI